ncbi:UNVERIFIED_CONTAM: putative ribosome quality control (RQC) complex YloA/Tae2 family protein [Brevibacillus sp. OAP136]
MAFDGVVTRAVAHELAKLKGGRISRIHQPHESDLVFAIRAQGGNQKLLLSANPTYPRIHLTTEEFVNPTEAPMFCMLLRKHCEGGTIESVEQVGMERIIHIDVRSRDELGDVTHKRIIVEIMGKHSNIILIDVDKQMILDSAHHVSHGMSQHRQVLPGRPYISPPAQGKADPLQETQADFIARINWNEGKLDKQIVDRYSGVSPLLAKEIVFRAGLPTRESLWTAFSELFAEVKQNRYAPNTVITKEKAAFSVTSLTHLIDGERTTFADVSDCLQHFFQDKAQRDVIKQKVHDLLRIVTLEKQKNEKKIEKLKQTLIDAQDAERFRLYGELITAHLHQLKRGDTVLSAVNWYDEAGGTIDIPLDPLLTPSENLQAYFKKYNKAKNSLQFVEEQIRLAEEEILYLDGLLMQLEYSRMSETEEIRDELAEQGYVRKQKQRNARKKKDTRPELEEYVSSDGTPILVGKNNKQNEYLTNKLAAANETWLHTKDIPGSHVVIRAREFSEQTLQEAAMLAAFFSKAREGSQVPVDYTLIRNVKKPNGAKPGFVIYEQQRTIYVTPDSKTIDRLKKQNRTKPAAANP